MSHEAFDAFHLNSTTFHQGDHSFDLDVSVQEDVVVVEHRLETTAEYEGTWDGVIEVFTGGDEPATTRSVTGFVDGFDEPPFTEGVEAIRADEAGIEPGQEVEVVFTYTNPDTVSDSATVTLGTPNGNGGFMTPRRAAALGLTGLGIGALALRSR